MKTFYNRIAGQSLERLAALSDGIFAVAMTLLVLDLHTPVAEASVRLSTPMLWTSQGLAKEFALLTDLASLAPHLLPYVLSFLTLGIFWVGQQTQLNHLEHSNRSLTWIHLAFLFCVTLMPFSTRLLVEFLEYRSALVAYWATIFLLGATLYASWGCATRGKLVKSDIPREVPAAICRRITIGQALYAFGALLCIFNTYWSIAFIVLAQLNYAIAPRFWPRKQGAKT